MNTKTDSKMSIPPGTTKDDPDSLLIVGFGDNEQKMAIMADGFHSTQKSITFSGCRFLPPQLDPVTHGMDSAQLWQYHYMSDPLPGTLVVPQEIEVEYFEFPRPDLEANWDQIIDDLLTAYTQAPAARKPRIMEKLQDARHALLHTLQQADA